MPDNFGRMKTMSEVKKFVYPPTGVEHRGKIIDSKDGFDVIECETCGFKHIIPIPSKEQLDTFYSNKFYEQERKIDYFERQKSQLNWWNQIFIQRCNLFEKILNRKGKILDIGCGPGFFLKQAQVLGWQGIGIDPSKKASDYAVNNLKLDVINCSLDAIDIESKELKEVDVVYANGVLEHMIEPKLFFKFGYDLLKNNGILFFSVANDYNPFQKILKKYKNFPSWWLVPPEHINYFDVNSAQSITERHGFEVVSLKTTFPIDIFLLMGDDYVSEPDLGKLCHQKRVNFEDLLHGSGNDGLLNNIYDSFMRLGLGRDIEVAAIRR